MKKLRLLLLILAAVLVAQFANAQPVHDQWVIPLDHELIWCLDEPVSGELVYDVKYTYDKDGNLVKFSLHHKGGFLTGESGTLYKLIDIGKETFGVYPLEGEYMFIGIYKIIAPGEGRVYDGRIQIHIDIDQCGEPVIKKYVYDLCV